MSNIKFSNDTTKNLLKLSKNLLNKKLKRKKPIRKKPIRKKKPKKKKGGGANNTYIDDNIDKIGILDPEGKYLNPLTMEPYMNLYKNNSNRGDTYKGYAMNMWSKLPAYTYGAKKIIDMINENQVTMVVAGTGSGKTVLVPKYVLHALKYKGRVISTNPKRVPTRENAKFAAKCLDVKLGDQVGYVIKGDKMITKDTKLIFATDGWVAAKLTGDNPLLEEYDCVIIDEVHERKINMDMLLLLLKGVCKKRPEFKLIIVSATVDVSIFRNYYSKDFKFGELDLPGEPNFPITPHFLKEPIKDYMKKGIEIIVDILKKNEEHDILFFLPGPADCGKACGMLESKMKVERTKGLAIKQFCIVMSSKTKPNESDLITNDNKYKTYSEDGFTGGYNRKVIMSTNAGESSLTVPNLKFVVDCGYEKHPGYDPEVMAETLKTQFTTHAQATQRKGRCGRTFPGEWYPLYTEKQFNSFVKYPLSEILKSDLTEPILNFFSMDGVDTIIDVIELLNSLIEVPSIDYVKSAFHSLLSLGAIEIIQQAGDKKNKKNKNNSFLNIDNFKNGKLTKLGKRMAIFRNTNSNIKKTLVVSEEVSKEIALDITKDICDLCAIYMACDGSIDKLFTGFICSKMRPDPNDKKKMSEYRKIEGREREIYKSKIKKVSSSYGDFITMYKVFNLYKKLKYEMIKSGDDSLLDNFAHKYKIKKSGWKVFTDAVNMSRAWIRAMKKNSNFQIIDSDDFMNTNKKTNINSNDVRGNISENQIGGADNKRLEGMLKCITIGYIDKLAQLTKDRKFRTCFPNKMTINKINRNSTINLFKNDFKYYVYGKLFEGDFGSELTTVNGIPEKYITMLPDNIKKYIIRCIEGQKKNFQFNYKNS